MQSCCALAHTRTSICYRPIASQTKLTNSDCHKWAAVRSSRSVLAVFWQMFISRHFLFIDDHLNIKHEENVLHLCLAEVNDTWIDRASICYSWKQTCSRFFYKKVCAKFSHVCNLGLALFQSEDPSPTIPTHRKKDEKWKNCLR